MTVKLEKDLENGQYRNEQNVSAATSLAVLCTDDKNVLTVGLVKETTGTGKIQFTLSSASSVIAGTAVWIDWPAGSVTATTVDRILGPVTAVRAIVSSGVLRFYVVA